jgi:hypothetical protein
MRMSPSPPFCITSTTGCSVGLGTPVLRAGTYHIRIAPTSQTAITTIATGYQRGMGKTLQVGDNYYSIQFIVQIEKAVSILQLLAINIIK